jgi:alpha-D-ribose 1-methylphosphonate 5-triphosphate synthase subunit PhnI
MRPHLSGLVSLTVESEADSGSTLQASGYVQHLKLPHDVAFQAGVQRLRRSRAA